MQYQHHWRLALVAQSPEELAACRSRAPEAAGCCRRWDMRSEEILGSDAFVRRLVEAALGDRSPGDDFLVVPPGGRIDRSQFLR